MKNVLVLVEDGGPKTVDEVADAMRERGMQVETVLRGMRTIAGTVADGGVMERLRDVSGVKSVREEGTVTLPPISRDIPQ